MIRRGMFILMLLTMLAIARGDPLVSERIAKTSTAPATISTAPATLPSAHNAVVIRLHGTIDDLTRDALFRRFDAAHNLGADTIILDINTYGGLVTSGLDISRFLKQQKDAHVIAFVGEKAISAGVMIALAADEIVMAPSALMGDSAPIAVGATGGMETLGDTERAKAESPILEDFYDSAIRNGYDPLLAQSMVSVGRSVHWIQNIRSGERRFVDSTEYKNLVVGDNAAWKTVAGVRDPVDSAETLLTVHTDLALKLGLARGEASSPTDLAQQRGLTILSTLEPSAGETFVGWLNSTVVRSLLIMIFMASLYTALHTPGHGGAEAVAVITLGALVGVPVLTGYAQWWEVVAILVGLVLIAMEIFVIPGFGIVGISGIVLFFAGLIMTFVGTEPVEIPGWLPTLSGTWSALRTGLYTVAIAMACSLFLWFWLSKYLPQLPYFNRLILTSTGGVVGDVSHFAPEGPVVGDHAEAVSDLRPSGQVRLARDGRIIAVVSESGFLQSGASVIVREIGGNRVVVRAREA